MIKTIRGGSIGAIKESFSLIRNNKFNVISNFLLVVVSSFRSGFWNEFVPILRLILKMWIYISYYSIKVITINLVTDNSIDVKEIPLNNAGKNIIVRPSKQIMID